MPNIHPIDPFIIPRLRLRNDQVLLLLDREREHYGGNGTLVLPRQDSPRPFQFGYVLAVGPGKRRADGLGRIPPTVEPGNDVLFFDLPLPGDPHRLIASRRCRGVLPVDVEEGDTLLLVPESTLEAVVID